MWFRSGGNAVFAGLLFGAGLIGLGSLAAPVGDAGARLAFPHLVSSAAPNPAGAGYWDVYEDGAVVAENGATSYGDMSGTSLNAPMINIAPTSDGAGYWLLGADGGIFSFGDAHFFGLEVLNVLIGRW